MRRNVADWHFQGTPVLAEDGSEWDQVEGFGPRKEVGRGFG